MTLLPRTSLPALFLVLGLPGMAQSPLFTDGTALGGSRVFSAGINPMGNPARLDKAAPGFYLGFLEGDERPSVNLGALAGLGASDPGLVGASLGSLKASPWAQRTQAFGLSYLREGAQFSLAREAFTSLWAQPDQDPAHLGSTAALLLNGTQVLGRRDSVDRLTFGSTTTGRGFSTGFSFRVERWSQGLRQYSLNPAPGQPGLRDPVADLLAIPGTDRRTLAYALDLGLTYELAPGVRMGATVDHVNPKHLWDVYEQMQVRAGLQADLGESAQLSLEQDINEARRMPFVARQRIGAASLRLAANPTVTFVVGVERRKFRDADASTRGGVTLFTRLPSVMLGLGFQFSKDRPLKGASLLIN